MNTRACILPILAMSLAGLAAQPDAAPGPKLGDGARSDLVTVVRLRAPVESIVHLPAGAYLLHVVGVRLPNGLARADVVVCDAPMAAASDSVAPSDQLLVHSAGRWLPWCSDRVVHHGGGALRLRTHVSAGGGSLGELTVQVLVAPSCATSQRSSDTGRRAVPIAFAKAVSPEVR